MTFTYDQNLLTDRDKVRFLSGDVGPSPGDVSDETIAGLLTMYSDVFRAAAAICRSMASRYSKRADVAHDSMRKNLSQISAAYAKRAEELEAQAGSSSPTGSNVLTMYAGGISRSRNETYEEDDDLTLPGFRRDTMISDTDTDPRYS